MSSPLWCPSNGLSVQLLEQTQDDHHALFPTWHESSSPQVVQQLNSPEFSNSDHSDCGVLVICARLDTLTTAYVKSNKVSAVSTTATSPCSFTHNLLPTRNNSYSSYSHHMHRWITTHD
jgi:hypothetical protein